MRDPAWRPDEALEQAVKDAIRMWQERQPRRRREPGISERDEFLGYAWCFRGLNAKQVHHCAGRAMTLANGYWPDPGEVDRAIADARRAAQAKRAQSLAVEGKRWSGDELAPCPTCGTAPRYTIQRGANADAWVFSSPDCRCCGWAPTTMHSLHLRGIRANATDDPIALARMHRDSANLLVTNWRLTGKRLAEIVLGAA